MGYLSFDCSTKIKYSRAYTNTKSRERGNLGISGFLHHIDRGTDRKNGCEVTHSNTDINSDLTLLNESYYKADSGDWKTAIKSGEMKDSILNRVNFAKEHGARIYTSGKNDTVILRPLLIQLSDITGHEESWKWDVIEILEEQFGKENIRGFSIHKDETNVHMHVCFTPVYETEKNGEKKCVISQTKFFKNPKQLAGLHKKIRKKLLDKGYDIEQENKSIDEVLAGYYDKDGKFHQQGLTPNQLKELSAKRNYLEKRCIDMDITYKELMEMNQNMSDMMKTSKDRQEEMERKLKKERESLSTQQTALENDRATLQSKEYDLLIKEMKVQRMEEDVENTKREADEMLENAYAAAEICNQILTDQTTLNPDFLDFLEREGSKRKKPFRQFVETWYKNFLNEYKDKISDDNSNLQMELKQRMDDCSKAKKLTVRNLPYLKGENNTYTCGLFK